MAIEGFRCLRGALPFLATLALCGVEERITGRFCAHTSYAITKLENLRAITRLLALLFLGRDKRRPGSVEKLRCILLVLNRGTNGLLLRRRF